MKEVFADTSFYVALANPKDGQHEAALDASEQWAGAVLTTEFVLLEVGNYFCNPSSRGVFLDLMEDLRNDADTTIIPASSALFDEGLQLYSMRPDQGWSLTDCISFWVMRQYAISDALTCDHHFEQAGFRLLVRR